MAAWPAAARSTRRRLAVYPGSAAGLRVYFQEEGDDKEWGALICERGRVD
jgi:hypothetical protein